MNPSQVDKSPQHREIGERTMAFLAQHRLATSPINYWVAHDYLMRSNASMCAALDSAIGASSEIDDFVMRDIYEQYVAGEAVQQFRGMGEDLERLLGGLLENVQSANQNASGLQASVNENLARLDEVRDSSGLRSIAHNLVQAALTANESNAVLKKSLEATEQEAKLLRGELDKHRREAMVDPLTGLLNRRGMLIEAGKLFEGSDGPPALLVMDIDHFKKINDTYGHAVGDIVIRKVAEAMSAIAPNQAMTARFGGEEFVMLVPNASMDLAQQLAEKVRTSIERLRLVRRHDKLEIAPFTISVGVALRQRDESLEPLFDRADQALYRAKHNGRNCVVASS